MTSYGWAPCPLEHSDCPQSPRTGTCPGAIEAGEDGRYTCSHCRRRWTAAEVAWLETRGRPGAPVRVLA